MISNSTAALLIRENVKLNARAQVTHKYLRGTKNSKYRRGKRENDIGGLGTGGVLKPFTPLTNI